MTRVRRLRVMHVVPDLGLGGITQVVAALAQETDRDRFDVEVLALNSGGEWLEAFDGMGVPVTVLGKEAGFRNHLAFRRVAEVLRLRRIDVLHTHNTQAMMDGTLGAWAAGVRTTIHTDHARPFPDKRRYMLAEHVLSYLAYRMVGVSEHTTENLRRYERIPRGKLVTIPNGIQRERFESGTTRSDVLASWGIPESSVVVGTAARLVPQKRLHDLLKAGAILAPRFPELQLILVGDGPLRPELEALAEELGITERTHFLGLRTDMVDVLRGFDVFALTSAWEGLPMAVLEAMAAGLVVVATDVGGVAAAIDHRVHGLLTRPGDPEAFAGALGDLLADPSLRARLAKAGWQRVGEDLSARTMARRYERLYRRLPLEAVAGTLGGAGRLAHQG